MAMYYGEKRALNELQSIVDSQWSNGMLPQIRFVKGQTGYSPDASEWGVKKSVSGNQKVETSGITQPPNPAYALWKVFGESENKTEMVPKVEVLYSCFRKYHDFLLTERDPKKEGLASVFHPWATGSDNTPCFDALIEETRKELEEKGYEQRIKKRKDSVHVAKGQRPKNKDYECYGRLLGLFVAKNYNQKVLFKECPFVVQDVIFNSILKASISSMASISKTLAKQLAKTSPDKASYYKNEIQRNKQLALRVRNGIRKKLWDQGTGLFYSFDVKGNQLIKISTVHSLSPMFGATASKEQGEELIKHLLNEHEFNPKDGFMVPSTPLNSKEFNAQGYPRGPVWPVRNWIVAKGLENYDRHLAERLKKQTLALIAQEHKGVERLEYLAGSLMEHNSFGESFTTPSKTQYCHGWLWDSGFAALGWRHVKQKPSTKIWKDVDLRKKRLVKEGLDLKEAKHALEEEFDIPLFDECFTPVKTDKFEAGSPLGSDKMTWTASLFLDLLRG